MASPDKHHAQGPDLSRNPGTALPADTRPTDDNTGVHEKTDGTIEEAEHLPKTMTEDDLPPPEAVIEALGIPNWRELEKKAVRRLDMTMMPAFLILYLFNYLDRAALS